NCSKKYILWLTLSLLQLTIGTFVRASTFWGLGVFVSLLSFQTQAQSWEQCVPDGPRVALTFDDGPVAGKTPVILNILKEYNVPATFFVLGQNVRYHPEI